MHSGVEAPRANGNRTNGTNEMEGTFFAVSDVPAIDDEGLEGEEEEAADNTTETTTASSSVQFELSPRGGFLRVLGDKESFL